MSPSNLCATLNGVLVKVNKLNVNSSVAFAWDPEYRCGDFRRPVLSVAFWRFWLYTDLGLSRVQEGAFLDYDFPNENLERGVYSGSLVCDFFLRRRRVRSGGGNGGADSGGGGGGGENSLQITLVSPSVEMWDINVGLVNITGTGFTSQSEVLLDGVPTSATQVVDSQHIEGILPGSSLPLGVHQISVQNGTQISNTLPYTYYYPAAAPVSLRCVWRLLCRCKRS